MRIFERFILLLLTPCINPWVKIRYGNIWKYQLSLQHKVKPSRLSVKLFDAWWRQYGSWIGYSAKIEGEPCLPHGPMGIFISNGASLGKNCVIFQHVTIGSNSLNEGNRSGSPKLGNNVYIGAGAKIIGNISIGDNCRIGANAVVYADMEPNSVAVAASTRIIQKQNLDNRFITQHGTQIVYWDNGKWLPLD